MNLKYNLTINQQEKMKHLILTLYVMCLSNGLNAQSVSVSKIFKYLQSQKQEEVSKDLINLGFQFDKKEANYNATLFNYHKAGTYGLEKFSFGYNDELFSLIYKPANNFYSTMKEKVLTSNFIYSYSHGNTKYYESSDMRIGTNDMNKIISFFVKLNE